ncbi:MAG: DedA family protein [Chloroflexota bacterium]|nr:MAG: DedA family protein [Chloroflexota bacterium]
MSKILEQIHLWLEQMIITLGYTGIIVAMFLESLFPPIPSELLMPFAGFLASQGHLSFSGIVLAGTAGSLLGALTLYYLGQYVGEPLIRTFIRRYGHYLFMAERDLNRSLDFFERYSESIVFLGRFIPLVRSLISVPAGMNRMPLGRFVFFTALGSGLWNGLMSYIGVILGENWAELLIFVKQYEILVVATLVALILFFVLKRAPQFIAFQPKPEDTE